MKKNIGIWLDHTKAHLMEFQNGEWSEIVLTSEYESRERFAGESARGTRLGRFRSSNDEYSKHHKKEELMFRYYKTLRERIYGCENVLLFGSGTAKQELYNFLNEDKRFNHIIIQVEESGTFTENQRNSFVVTFFNN